MREAMPITAAFIDSFREAFGADIINASIKAGMQGHPGAFYASEAGQTIGTPAPDLSAVSIKLSETLVGPMNKPKKERN